MIDRKVLIEKIARELCYWSGDKPDVWVHPHKAAALVVTHNGYPVMGFDDGRFHNPVRAWQTHAGFASVAADAFREAVRESGYVIVPREPTVDMASCGKEESLREGAHDCEVSMADVWRAMIDAAPDVPKRAETPPLSVVKE